MPKPTAFSEHSPPGQAPVFLRLREPEVWLVEKGAELICRIERTPSGFRVVANGRTWMFRFKSQYRIGYRTDVALEGTLEGENDPSVFLCGDPQTGRLHHTTGNYEWRPKGSRIAILQADHPLLEFHHAWRDSEVDAGILYGIWPLDLTQSQLPPEILYAFPILRTILIYPDY